MVASCKLRQYRKSRLPFSLSISVCSYVCTLDINRLVQFNPNPKSSVSADLSHFWGNHETSQSRLRFYAHQCSLAIILTAMEGDVVLYRLQLPLTNKELQHNPIAPTHFSIHCMEFGFFCYITRIDNGTHNLLNDPHSGPRQAPLQGKLQRGGGRTEGRGETEGGRV